MNKIIIRIDEGLGVQHLYFYEDDKMTGEESITMDSLVDYLLNTCYNDNIYNLHFLGNWAYISGLIEQISTEEATKYNTNKILIEVN